MNGWNKITDGHFFHDDGRTVRREYGKTPNGNDLNGRWVYRNSDGLLIDFDQYWNDLIPRNRLHIEK